jgi:pimeloyl-ACP methyl ester carboxylesterase
VSGVEHYSVRTADGVRVALHRLRPKAEAALASALLVPGTFCNRTFWLGTREHGFARFLAAAGFDCWVAELRGHGSSQRPPLWTMQEWVCHDAPALLETVLREARGNSCFWVGHSAGGAVGAAAMALYPELTKALTGAVLLGAPGPGGLRGPRRVAARAIAAAGAWLPGARVSGAAFGLGPEPESATLIAEWVGWNVAGAWSSRNGTDYLAALGARDVPLLAVAGAGDRFLAPPAAVRDLAERFGSRDRTLVIAGRTQGYSLDYGHADLIVGRAARTEIWPLVLDWLRARAGTFAPTTSG